MNTLKFSMAVAIFKSIVLLSTLFPFQSLKSQCTMYNVNVILDGACPQASQVNWLLIGSDGTVWLSGGAPFTQTLCLPDDCYTLQMQDTGGDGWECVDWFISDLPDDFSWDTNLQDGNFGTDQVALGMADCTGGNGGSNCPIGTQEITLEVDDGDSPIEISWELSLGGITVVSGGPDITNTLCLGNGCFVFELFDSGANGWENAEFVFTDADGNEISSGTLSAGAYDYVVLNIGGLDCDNTIPDDGGGGGGGGGGNGSCGLEPPGQDCSAAACVCDPYVFSIAPMGFGTFNEIPSPGSVSNPYYTGNAPWGGSDTGCLLAGELNSFWMLFTIANSGNLEFSFGQNNNGGQLGFYDWSMWNYTGTNTCIAISDNLLPPVRCVWNAVSSGGTGLATIIPSGGNAGNYGPALNVLAGQQYLICFSNWSYASGMVTLDFFGTAQIECGMVLPIELIAFNALPVGQDVQLDWTTASEWNNAYFEIQSSTDAEHWETIGNVQGAGTTQEFHNYTFTHKNAKQGTNYYQLIQHDFNDAMHFSDVVAAYIDEREWKIYPNPTSGTFTISGLGKEPYSVLIFNNIGEIVFESTMNDIDQLVIDSNKLIKGLYIVQISDQRTQKSMKLMVE